MATVSGPACSIVSSSSRSSALVNSASVSSGGRW